MSTPEQRAPYGGSPSIAPGRSSLRRMLRALMTTDGDFDAFCLDYFSDVHWRFSAGMDRLTKANLLLELSEPAQVLSRLRQHYGGDRDSTATIERLLAEPGSEEEQRAQMLRDALERLYIEREQRRLRGRDIADLDERIVEIKRTQRQTAQLHEGEILGDRYRLLEVVGRGGFARVWQAYDRDARCMVAVKILHSESSDDLGRVQRFVRGARQMRGLEHPNIVRVLDGPAEHHGFHYFVMDYLPGGDLSKGVTSGVIKLHEAVRAILSVGVALEHAHSRGLIHRDVKPQNILLDGEKQARLTDFDLVWASDTTGATQGFLGTHIYAAPEQAENAADIDQRADVYSLGMTLMFAIHRQALPQRAMYQRERFIAELRCGSWVKTLLRNSTAIELSERISSMAVFCSELEKLVSGKIPQELGLPVEGQSFSDSQTLVKRSRTGQGRRRLLITVIGVVLALLLAGGVRLAMNTEPAKPIIRWSVSTDPSGAAVIRADDGKILGRTPWTQEQQIATGQLEIRISKSDYKPQNVTLDRSRGQSLNITLESALPPSPPLLSEPLQRQQESKVTPKKIGKKPALIKNHAAGAKKADDESWNPTAP